MPNTPKTYFFLPEDLHIYELPQIFSASAGWFEFGMDKEIATFDLIIRDMPPNRNFMVMCGIEEALKGILSWGYTDEEIRSLLENKVITPKFAEYLKNFKFKGDVYAIPEGTVFFQGEPVIRITAPLIDANLMTMFLLNVLCGNVKFASKIIRCVNAAHPKKCVGVVGLRAESFESAMKCARASYIVGSVGSNLSHSFARKFNLPTSDAMVIIYHAVIKSFPSEIEAMRKFCNLYKNKVNLMVDTYDFDQGMKNAIIVAKELKAKGSALKGITIDSGNLYKRALKARKMLDKEGLQDVKITITGNLDEYKIKKYMDDKITADSFILATEEISVPDAPKIESVYKLTELRNKNKITYCAKFSENKESYPGRKQVFRVKEKGVIKKDIIGLEDEKLGEPLLKKMVENGKLIYKLPSLDEIKERVKDQVKQLPKKYLEIEEQYPFEVEISKKLQDLFLEVKKTHKIT